MKFKIFGLSEKYYKIVTAIVTIVVTLGCFVYYDGLDDKGNTFVVATLYAAFLLAARKPQRTHTRAGTAYL